MAARPAAPPELQYVYYQTQGLTALLSIELPPPVGLKYSRTSVFAKDLGLLCDTPTQDAETGRAPKLAAKRSFNAEAKIIAYRSQHIGADGLAEGTDIAATAEFETNVAQAAEEQVQLAIQVKGAGGFHRVGLYLAVRQ